MAEHEGWTNYETWNVALWVDNDYGLYSLKTELLKESTHQIEHYHVAEFFRIHMNSTTPDLEPGDIHEINWEEIAQNWEEERLERMEG